VSSLIPRHGGYRHLKTFQLGRLIYDLTVHFADRYVDKRSRTRDQMVQAARSGVQNIAEGNQASGTSKKSELKLTNVARASLEELRLDYEDHLRQRGHVPWPPDALPLQRFKKLRCADLAQVIAWAEAEPGGEPADVVYANGALSLLNLTCYLLDRQIHSLAETFEREGGFTERLYRVRRERRSD
jgi:four helix bundle suffix protein